MSVRKKWPTWIRPGRSQPKTGIRIRRQPPDNSFVFIEGHPGPGTNTPKNKPLPKLIGQQQKRQEYQRQQRQHPERQRSGSEPPQQRDKKRKAPQRHQEQLPQQRYKKRKFPRENLTCEKQKRPMSRPKRKTVVVVISSSSSMSTGEESSSFELEFDASDSSFDAINPSFNSARALSLTLELEQLQSFGLPTSRSPQLSPKHPKHKLQQHQSKKKKKKKKKKKTGMKTNNI
eukprot:TRINITY_DN13645_c0_g1_i2.p1 TRINITY_DN13645_c0_g1~~TRINITY_DN13645_c0_g1_i2.p1  ORF type:complete len:231 (-),score=45.74 TRINITY_DN13645_c0_g1_i2:84-776(-)